MKFESKEVLKAFLPILMDILKGILAYLRSHKMGDDKEFEKGLSQAAVLARCIIGESEKYYGLPENILAAAEIEDPRELDPLCDFS
jgi:hypothetical protein